MATQHLSWILTALQPLPNENQDRLRRAVDNSAAIGAVYLHDFSHAFAQQELALCLGGEALQKRLICLVSLHRTHGVKLQHVAFRLQPSHFRQEVMQKLKDAWYTQALKSRSRKQKSTPEWLSKDLRGWFPVRNSCDSTTVQALRSWCLPIDGLKEQRALFMNFKENLRDRMRWSWEW